MADSDSGRSRQPVGTHRAEPSSRATGLGEGASGLSDQAVARRLIEGLVLPLDEQTLRSRTTDDVLPAAYCALVKAAHDLLVVQQGYDAYRQLAQSWTERVVQAEADAEVARERLDGVEERNRKLLGDIDRLKKEKSSALADLIKETNDAHSLRKRLQAAQSAATVAAAEKATAEASLEAVRAESLAGQLEAQAAKAVAEQMRAELETERKNAAMAALTEYKSSAEYKAEVGKASDAFYLAGFADCKAEFADRFPGLDVSLVADPVAAEGSDEEPSGAEEGEITEPTATAVDPVEAPTEEPIDAPTAAGPTERTVAEVATEEPVVGDASG